jgi:acyl carrier protein
VRVEVAAAMATEEISRRVQDVIATSLKLEPDQVKPEASFKDDLDVDSLDVIEMAVAMEKEFGIQVPDEALPKIKTVQDVIDYVESRAS